MVERISQIGKLEDMAERVGITHQQLSYIEQRIKGTRADTANKIAGILGLKFTDLFEVVSSKGKQK